MRNRLALLAALLAAAGCHQDRTRGLDSMPQTPPSLDFGAIAVGRKGVLPLSVTNGGSLALRVSQGTAPEPFGVDGLPEPIDPGSTGDVFVTFAPTVAGAVDADLQVLTSSTVLPSVQVKLHGVAFNPELAAAPERLDFGDVQVGATKSLTFTIIDRSPVPLTPQVEPADPASDFGVTPQGYLPQLKPDAQETVQVSFTPSVAGPAQSALLLTCSICPVKQVVLTGNGIQANPGPAKICALSASPARLAFAPLDPGQSASQTTTLSSTGTGTCFINLPYLSPGTDPSLTVAGLAPFQLAPGQTQQLTATFAPTTSTHLQVNGALVLVSNDKLHSPLSIPLTGAVNAPPPPPPPPPPAPGVLTVTPSQLSFSAQAPVAPPSQQLTVSNTGGQDLSFTAQSDDGAVSLSQVQGSLAPGASVNVTVMVAGQPFASVRTSHLVFNAKVAGSVTVPVQITFAPPVQPPPQGKLVVSPLTLAFVAQVPNAPPDQKLTLSNTGGQSLDYTASADDAAIGLSDKGGTLAPGETRTVTVSVAAQQTSGVRTQTILVDAGVAGSANVAVDIKFTDAPPPPPPPNPAQLVVLPMSLTFRAISGTAPSPQQLTVENTGDKGQALSWTAQPDDPAISLSTASGSLDGGGSAMVTVSIAAQPATSRTQYILFDAGAAGQVEVPIDIIFDVPPPPPNPAQLVVTPLQLTFTAVAPAAPPAQSVTLQNIGGADLSWTAIADDATVSLSSSAGQLAGGNSSSLSIAVAAQPFSGQRISHVTVDAGAAGHAVVELDITFTSPPPPPPPQYGSSVWPKWHQGNTNTGLSTIDTSANQGVVAWTAQLGPPRGCIQDVRTNFNLRCGTYVNSPVLADDGTVYELGGDGTFFALDRATGTTVWSTPTAQPWIAANEGTPTVVKDGSVFLMTGGESSNQSQFFHLGRDGSVLWQNTPGQTCNGRACDGYDSSPALGDDGTLYEADDEFGSIDAFDQSGNALGMVALSPHSDIETQSGALAPDNNGYWAANGHLWALAPGQQLWSFTAPEAVGEADWDPPASFYNRKSSPAVTADGQVIFAWAWAHGDGTYSTRVYSFAAGGTQRELWHATLGPSTPTPGLPGGPGLAGDDPDMLHYRNGLTSPAVGPDGTIYIGHVDGLFAIEPKTGHLEWSVGMGEVVSSPAVGADGTVYVGSIDGYLYAIKDGTISWQVKTGGQINSSPAIGADGTVYVMSDDGNLYAVK